MNQLRSAVRRGPQLLAAGAMSVLCGCGAKATAPTNASLEPNATLTKALDTTKARGANELVLKTRDGWRIVGDLYPASGKPKGIVLLLHQRGASAEDWQSLATALQAAGITAYAFDQRGAGRSTQGPGPTGEAAPWNTSGDIQAALAHFAPAGRPFGIIGASYGANNALIYAGAHPSAFRGVVLLSPGANYHGLNALPPARQYRGALLIYHATEDSVAGNGPKAINAASRSANHTLKLRPGDGHGTALLSDSINADIVAFFTRRLGAKP